MQEHHIEVRRRARYYTLGPTDRDVAEAWIVCHGYAQLAGRFMRHFEGIDDGTRLIVAPEALNRFYVETVPMVHGPESRVGATWMTREDRLHEIEDYVDYLDELAESIFSRLDRARARLTVLGFSQAVATVSRWAVQGRTHPDHLILWGSPLPPEIDVGAGAETLGAIPRISFVVGASDADAQRALPRERERLDRLGVRYRLVGFEGGHHLDAETLRALAQPAGPR